MTMIAPWLSVADATQAVAFYVTAYDATLVERVEDAPGSIVIAQLAIGDACFWVQQDDELNPSLLEGRSPVRMILSVDDPDFVFARALAAGAVCIAQMHEDNGWRIGRLIDPAGHQWEIGRPI